MQEWFLRSDGRYPPPHVWVAQLLHLLMLAGFAMMVKWDKAGAVVALVFSVAFFLQISRFHPPAFALINLVPMALFCLWWFIPDPARNSPSPGGV